MTCAGNATAIKKGPLHFGEWLSALRATTTVAFGPLRLVRLMGDLGGPNAELLDECLPSGRTSITEVGASGLVALVCVSHAGTLPLLLVDGEQIVGARQNRIVNASFLIGPGQSSHVPVSCVERGRWHCKSSSFDSSETTIVAGARAAKLRHLQASLGSGRGHDGNQAGVWRDVDRYLARTGTSSESAAFDDAFRRRRAHADQGLLSFGPAAGQLGMAAVREGSLVALDLFGSPSLYDRGWRKVARGTLAEVYNEGEAPSEANAVAIVTAAIREMASCEPVRAAAPGIGQTWHADTGGVTFTSVVCGDVLYHAVAVAAEDLAAG